MMRSRRIRLLAPALLLLAAAEARAIVVITSPNSDGSAPYTVSQIDVSSATFANSGYAGSGNQYEGQWGDGGGTVVGPDEFLTATHLDPDFTPGTFVFDGKSYATTGYTDVGNGMTLWTVSGAPFTSYATIYANSSASNSVMGSVTSDFGYGVVVGSAVTGPDGTQGYTWGGANGGNLSWGASQALGYVPNPGGGDVDGTTLIGMAFLPKYGAYATVGGATVAMSSTMSLDDSGGGLFAYVNGQWQLVGVNLGVGGPPYYTQSMSNGQAVYTPVPNPSNPQYAGYASLYDQSGFYSQNADGTYSADTGPQDSYADAITQAVYQQIVGVPEPATSSLLAVGAALIAAAGRLRGRRAGRPGAT